jgi:hypothetical protein
MKQLAAQPAAMDATCTLLDLLQQRKTRRFGRGMTLPGGPLQYTSQHEPIPLSREEERYLIYAAIGRSGRNLGDMQFVGRPGASAGQGHALMNFNSRTVPSPCSAQSTQLFYTNDDGVFFVADAAGPTIPGIWRWCNSNRPGWRSRAKPRSCCRSISGIQIGPAQPCSCPSPISRCCI